MKKIKINFNKKDWLDDYDFLRDTVGIIKEENTDKGIVVWVNEKDYNDAIEEQ